MVRVRSTALQLATGRRARRGACGPAVALLLLASPAAGAPAPVVPQVAVLPLRSVDAPAESTRAVDAALMRGLGAAAIPRRRLRGRLMGADPAVRAEACGYAVPCLVELGARLGADVLVVGRLARAGGATSEGAWALELVAIDVGDGFVAGVSEWTFGTEDLDAAAQTLARQVALPSDARLVFDLEPAEARVSLYGEAIDVGADGLVDVAAGTYRIAISAPGHEVEVRRVSVAPTETVTVAARLALDPLAPAVPAADATLESFREERPLAGGDRVPPPTSGPSSRRWFRVLRWSGVAVASGVAMTGGALMIDAQSRYDGASAETRFSSSTTGALDAAALRGGARDQRLAGQVMLWTGLGLAVAGTIWALVDES